MIVGAIQCDKSRHERRSPTKMRILWMMLHVGKMCARSRKSSSAFVTDRACCAKVELGVSDMLTTNSVAILFQSVSHVRTRSTHAVNVAAPEGIVNCELIEQKKNAKGDINEMR